MSPESLKMSIFSRSSFIWAPNPSPARAHNKQIAKNADFFMTTRDGLGQHYGNESRRNFIIILYYSKLRILLLTSVETYYLIKCSSAKIRKRDKQPASVVLLVKLIAGIGLNLMLHIVNPTKSITTLSCPSIIILYCLNVTL